MGKGRKIEGKKNGTERAQETKEENKRKKERGQGPGLATAAVCARQGASSLVVCLVSLRDKTSEEGAEVGVFVLLAVCYYGPGQANVVEGGKEGVLSKERATVP